MDREQISDSLNTNRRLAIAVLILGLIVLGVLSVKRILNGNADLSGNYKIWSANLVEPTQPGRHMSAESNLQDPDPYPPITYALFAPLALVPLPLLAVLWYSMNVACTLYLWKSASSLLEELPSCRSCPCGPLLLTNSQIRNLASVAVLPAWIGTILIGQHTLLQMSLIVAALRTDIRELTGSLKAGTLLALAVLVKILPAVFLLPFGIRRQFRVLMVFCAVACCLIFGLGSLFFGAQKNWEFQHRWLQFAIHGPESRLPDPRDPNTLRGSLRDKNQSIEAVLARLVMDVPIHNRDADAPRVNLVSVSPAAWRIMSSGLVALCLLVGIVAVVRSQRANAIQRETDVEMPCANSLARLDSVLGRLAILSLMQLFISPLIWSHYYVWLFPPLVYLLSEVRRGRASGLWIYAAWLLLIPGLGIEWCRAVGTQLWVNLLLYGWICWPALVSSTGQEILNPAVRVPTTS